MKIHHAIIRLFLLIAAVAIGITGIYIEMDREKIPEKAGMEIEVLVPQGLSAREVAARFQQAGAVTNAQELAKWMARSGIDRKIKPGLYRVTAGRPNEVATQLSEIKPELKTATILPGALFPEIAASLGNADRAVGEVLFAEALDKADNFPEALRELLPEKTQERIVFLAPETYALNPGDGGADELVGAASDMWWKQHGDKIPKGATSEDMISIGILASIVQKEALVESDRPIIAGVFKNRLKQDMPLQSCATVVYAWRLKGVKITTVSYNDVKIDSPYNTYAHKGLPPANIGTPGENSWNAALEPADTDMLFFFAKADGAHIFTRTYKEHLEAQKKASQAP